jgi:hypothetical protein
MLGLSHIKKDERRCWSILTTSTLEMEIWNRITHHQKQNERRRRLLEVLKLLNWLGYAYYSLAHSRPHYPGRVLTCITPLHQICALDNFALHHFHHLPFSGNSYSSRAITLSHSLSLDQVIT